MHVLQTMSNITDSVPSASLQALGLGEGGREGEREREREEGEGLVKDTVCVASHTQASCSRECLARQTADAAISDGRYFKNGSECTRASSQRYCKMW